MAEEIMKYEPGTILLCESGAYSDFGYCGGLVTLKQIDMKELAAKFRVEKEKERINPDTFVAWLVAMQYCAPLECSTIYLGSHGKLDI